MASLLGQTNSSMFLDILISALNTNHILKSAHHLNESAHLLNWMMHDAKHILKKMKKFGKEKKGYLKTRSIFLLVNFEERRISLFNML